MNNKNKYNELEALLLASKEGKTTIPAGLIDLIPIGMTFVEVKSGLIVWCNEQLADDLGYEGHELWGKMTVYDITPEYDWHITQTQFESVSNFGRFGWYEKSYTRKNGDLIQIRIKGYAVEVKGEYYAVTVVEKI